MYLTHYDDHKEKLQSHEIGLAETRFYNAEYDLDSHNPLSVIGYGETKEEALEEFIKKFSYVMAELKAFESLLLDTDFITQDIKEVNCLGHLIE